MSKSAGRVFAGLCLLSLVIPTGTAGETARKHRRAGQRSSVSGGNSARKRRKTPSRSATPAIRQTKGVKGRSRRTRRRSMRTAERLANMRPSAQRVVEIQQALAQAGYLTEKPTGVWDDATKEAMRRYQTANGLPTTGLPESKSLMKLGLGPHPLPEDVNPGAAARPNEVNPNKPAQSGSTAAPATPEQAPAPSAPAPAEQPPTH